MVLRSVMKGSHICKLPGSLRVRVEATGASDSKRPARKLVGPAPHVKRPLWKQLDFFGDPFEAQSEILAKNDVATGSAFLQDCAFVGSAPLALEVLSRDADGYDVKTPDHFQYLFGPNSLANVSEPQHMRLRKMLIPSFSADEMWRYFSPMERIMENYFRQWASAGNVANFHAQIKLMTFEVVCSVVAGFDFSQQELEDLSSWFATVVSAIPFPFAIDLPFTPFGKAMAARRNIVTIVQTKIDQARQDLAARPGSPGGAAAGPSMMHKWITAKDENGVAFTDEQLQDTFLAVLMAGHDTTASSLNVLMYYLDQHPEVMQHLRDEQRDLMLKYGDLLSMQVLHDMSYGEAVMREVWRIRPVVPVVGRCPIGDVELGGYDLPGGKMTMVALSYILKMDPRWVGRSDELSPHKFNPDRWLTPEGSEAGAQLVFGAGKRSCLGMPLAYMESKMFIAVLARRYHHKILPGMKWTHFPFPFATMDCKFSAL